MSSIGWMGVWGKEPAQVIRELGYVEAGRAEDWSSRGEVTAAQWPTGWFLVFDWFDDKTAVALSAGCQAVLFRGSETSMSIDIVLYADGREVWRVEHDSVRDPDHMDHRGELPPEFPGILASLREQHERAAAEEEEVDYLFNVPVELGALVTGFRHDTREPEGIVYTVLKAAPPSPVPPAAPAPAPAPAPRRPWWKLW